MEVLKFEIEESKVNKGMFYLVAIVETGDKFVVGGQHQESNYCIPYDIAWDTTTMEEKKK